MNVTLEQFLSLCKDDDDVYVYDVDGDYLDCGCGCHVKYYRGCKYFQFGLLRSTQYAHGYVFR